MHDLAELRRLPDLPGPPQRVVSLVPSVTESLMVLGFGASVKGRTEYCIYPADKVASIPTVGGTKNPDIDAIKALDPDVVFVNQEENSEAVVDALSQAGMRMWLSFPKTPSDSIDDLRSLLAIYHDDSPAMLINSLQAALDWAQAAALDAPRKRYFCPVWQQGAGGEDLWWMTFNAETYPHALLDLMGGENVFAERERQYPLAADLGGEAGDALPGKDTRYPRVSVDEVIEAAPELILLPDEPFAFDASHQAELETLLAFTPAVREKRVKRVDGSLLFWHGVRLGQALQDLPELFF